MLNKMLLIYIFLLKKAKTGRNNDYLLICNLKKLKCGVLTNL